jgi:hypothetical protein
MSGGYDDEPASPLVLTRRGIELAEILQTGNAPASSGDALTFFHAVEGGQPRHIERALPYRREDLNQWQVCSAGG